MILLSIDVLGITLLFRHLIITVVLLLLQVTCYGAEPASKRCVIDSSQQSVCTTKAHPNLISLSHGTTELLYATDAGAQLLAVDDHSNYPPQVEKLPSVGGYPNINLEAIIAKQPDIVLFWQGGNAPELAAQLKAARITVFYSEAKILNDIAPALRAIGTLAGTTATTEKAIQQFTQRLAAMRQQYSTQKAVKVFFEIWRNPLMTVGNSQLISDVISLCGGQNLYNDVDKAIPTVSLESLIARNPQVIVTSGYHSNDLASYWSQYSIIEAVNKQQFLVLPGDLITRTTPRVLDGAALLCNYLQSIRL